MQQNPENSRSKTEEVATPQSKQAPAVIRPFNIWSPSRFLQWTEPPGSHILLPAYLDKAELTTLIGQGGIGKTRLP